jgi:hypothetical protein
MLHCFTYSTSPDKVKYLNLTAGFHKVEVKNLSQTTKWSGFHEKVNAVRDSLNVLPDTDIALFVDAYDVLVNDSSQKILEVFYSYNCKILFGAEKDLFPHHLKPLEPTYPTSSTEVRFLNSGVYIGYVGALKEMIGWADYQGKDDQEYFQNYFLRHQETVKLDVYSKLVLNMSKVPWSELMIQAGQVHHNEPPCLLHFNGMSYLDINIDMVTLNDTQKSFNYDFPYETTFKAIYISKLASANTLIRCFLIGRGHTY